MLPELSLSLAEIILYTLLDRRKALNLQYVVKARIRFIEKSKNCSPIAQLGYRLGYC